MVQLAKVLDITKSYVPVNPETFPSTLHGTNKEDYPVDSAPVVPYRGHNFLPTAYGYKSYFGTNAGVSTAPAGARVDELFPIQTAELTTMLVALCEDGIWLLENSTWSHPVVLPVPAEGTHYDWSYCYVDQRLYCYRSTDAHIYEVLIRAKVVEAPVPTPAKAGVLPAAFTISPYGNKLAAGAKQTIKYWLSAATEHGVAMLTEPSTLTDIEYNTYLFEIPVAQMPATTLTIYYTIVSADPEAVPVYKKLSVAYTGSATTKRFDINFANGTVTEEHLLIPSGTVQELTPTFLNMEGQQGIFAAGMRLGIWDSSNSVAWSAIDDPMDFTPSIETLAGSAVFSAVSGTIQRCLAHKDGFIIYSTGSIVLVDAVPEATFQWDSKPLLTNGGIHYAKQCVASYPSDEHYAFTKIGIVKIENKQLEFIVPQFYDELKSLDTLVFLNILEGRYLCFEVLDAEYLLGNVRYQNKMVGSTPITFMSDDAALDYYKGVDLVGSKVCSVLEGMFSSGVGSQSAAAADASATGAPPKQPGTLYSPIWEVTYTSFPLDGLTFVASECSAPLALHPSIFVDENELAGGGQVITFNSSTLGKVDPSHMLAAFGILLTLKTQKYDEYVQAILGASDTEELSEGTYGPQSLFPGYTFPAPYNNLGTTVTNTKYCLIGDFLTNWSDPQIAMGNCDAEVYMYATERITIKSKIETKQEISVDKKLGRGWVVASDPTGQEYATGDACCRAQGGYSRSGNVFPLPAEGESTVTQCYLGDWNWGGGDNYGSGSAGSATCYSYNREVRKNRTFLDGHNVITARDQGIFAKISVKLTLKGWTYTDTSGATQTLNKSGNSSYCLTPDNHINTPMPPSLNPSTNPDAKDAELGGICGIPFAPIHLPDTEFPIIDWPDQTVVIPPSSFLLQDGSSSPIYPTYAGAFVYDLHLKKWGKIKQDYKLLLNYNVGVNGQGAILDVEMTDLCAGVLHTDGRLSKFDNYPAESEIVYGKIGYHRLGFTSLEEIKVQFAVPCTGYLGIEGSMDGRHLEYGLTSRIAYDNIMTAELPSNSSARWYNITLNGHYDITHIEFRGTKSSRR